ncbi:MAG TPA: (d)CMP kinase [Brumimicrobium sp.]|nr:(d)CMP kinase [Brumimicrobium sp.]
MKKELTIAIDGWSSCGKSTLAKSLAKVLNYAYVDSGAMYRGIALFSLQNGLISPDFINTEGIINALPKITLSFSNYGKSELILNGENVENKIRTLMVSNVVSSIAKIKEVRVYLVAQQRQLGENGGVVMDGRDIGSVVFPNAELKIFLTASPEVRTQRRYDELVAKGEKTTWEEVRKNLELRDHTDANRKESPLIQTADAIVIDNSDLTPDEQLQKALNLVEEARKK